MREEAIEMNKDFDRVKHGEISEEEMKKKANENEISDSRDRALYHQEIRVKVRDHGRSIGKKYSVLINPPRWMLQKMMQ